MTTIKETKIMKRAYKKADGILIANAIGTDFYKICFTHEPENRIKTTEHGLHYIRPVYYTKLEEEIIKDFKKDLYSLIEHYKVKETWYQLSQANLFKVIDLLEK